jgi:hypothetical protein
VQRLRRIEKAGRNTRAIKRPGELLCDMRGFADAGKDQFAPGRSRALHRSHDIHKFSSQTSRRRIESGHLDPDASAGAGKRRFVFESHL